MNQLTPLRGIQSAFIHALHGTRQEKAEMLALMYKISPTKFMGTKKLLVLSEKQ